MCRFSVLLKPISWGCDGLRICWGKIRGGSNPLSPTILHLALIPYNNSMGVTPSSMFPEEEVTPTCNECGVSLCWDISLLEYVEDYEFWESWTCRDCNPNYEGALKRFRAKKHANNQQIS